MICGCQPLVIVEGAWKNHPLTSKAPIQTTPFGGERQIPGVREMMRMNIVRAPRLSGKHITWCFPEPISSCLNMWGPPQSGVLCFSFGFPSNQGNKGILNKRGASHDGGKSWAVTARLRSELRCCSSASGSQAGQMLRFPIGWTPRRIPFGTPFYGMGGKKKSNLMSEKVVEVSCSPQNECFRLRNLANISFKSFWKHPSSLTPTPTATLPLPQLPHPTSTPQHSHPSSLQLHPPIPPQFHRFFETSAHLPISLVLAADKPPLVPRAPVREQSHRCAVFHQNPGKKVGTVTAMHKCGRLDEFFAQVLIVSLLVAKVLESNPPALPLADPVATLNQGNVLEAKHPIRILNQTNPKPESNQPVGCHQPGCP